MIKTPIGKIITVESGNIIYPSVDIVLIQPDGTKDIIASIEYNTEDECISTYTYKANKEDFDKKTIYREVRK